MFIAGCIFGLFVGVAVGILTVAMISMNDEDEEDEE